MFSLESDTDNFSVEAIVTSCNQLQMAMIDVPLHIATLSASLSSPLPSILTFPATLIVSLSSNCPSLLSSSYLTELLLNTANADADGTAAMIDINHTIPLSPKTNPFPFDMEMTPPNLPCPSLPPLPAVSCASTPIPSVTALNTTAMGDATLLASSTLAYIDTKAVGRTATPNSALLAPAAEIQLIVPKLGRKQKAPTATVVPVSHVLIRSARLKEAKMNAVLVKKTVAGKGTKVGPQGKLDRKENIPLTTKATQRQACKDNTGIKVQHGWAKNA